MLLFKRDTTIRWACRAGDFVLWARFQGPFTNPGQEYKVSDVWQLKDGDFVTLTNRLADLPTGFDLHPLEVAGRFVPWMMKRIEGGYDPGEPVDGPSLWRVFAGDRIAWVDPSRAGVSRDEGVLEVVTFQQDSLVYGEPVATSGPWPSFGACDAEPPSEAQRFCATGWAAIIKNGIPNEASAEAQWRLG